LGLEKVGVIGRRKPVWFAVIETRARERKENAPREFL
jgi:hypothetical protein